MVFQRAPVLSKASRHASKDVRSGVRIKAFVVVVPDCIRHNLENAVARSGVADAFQWRASEYVRQVHGTRALSLPQVHKITPQHAAHDICVQGTVELDVVRAAVGREHTLEPLRQLLEAVAGVQLQRDLLQHAVDEAFHLAGLNVQWRDVPLEVGALARVGVLGEFQVYVTAVILSEGKALAPRLQLLCVGRVIAPPLLPARGGQQRLRRGRQRAQAGVGDVAERVLEAVGAERGEAGVGGRALVALGRGQSRHASNSERI